jgi:hypothetical protein
MDVLTIMRHQKRAALFSGVGLLAIALVAAAAARPAGGQSAAPERPVVIPPDPIAVELDARAERLNHWLTASVTPRDPVRNPFEFAPRPRPQTAAPPAVTVVPLTAPPVVPPSFTLVAIGQTGDTRTAIISAFGQVLLLKVGDQIASRFKVAAIGADVVELTDTLDNTPVRLALR